MLALVFVIPQAELDRFEEPRPEIGRDELELVSGLRHSRLPDLDRRLPTRRRLGDVQYEVTSHAVLMDRHHGLW